VERRDSESQARASSSEAIMIVCSFAGIFAGIKRREAWKSRFTMRTTNVTCSRSCAALPGRRSPSWGRFRCIARSLGWRSRGTT